MLWNIQGGTINRGLHFQGPLPLPMGVCEEKDMQKPMGGCPSDGVSGGWWWLDPCVKEITCRQIQRSKPCAEQQHFKIWEYLSSFFSTWSCELMDWSSLYGKGANRRTYPDGKFVFQWIQHRLRRWNHSAAVGGILDSGRLSTIFAWLELAWLLYLQPFASKSPG